MPNGHQHTRAVYIVSHISGASCQPSATNTLVTYISVLIYTLPRDHGVSPTHSCCIIRGVRIFDSANLNFEKVENFDSNSNWQIGIRIARIVVVQNSFMNNSKSRSNICE
jgi:hypothetical protein